MLYVRKCPMCKDGQMVPLHTHRGWGKEYQYFCNLCDHNKWIYEGSPENNEKYENSKSGFWIMLILVELIIFIGDDIIGTIGYTIYLSVLALFLYNLMTPNRLKLNYEIIGYIDKVTPDEADDEKQINYAQKVNKFWIYPVIFLGSIAFAEYSDSPNRYYYLLLAPLSFAFAYYYGFLEISNHRRKLFFKDRNFENDMDDITVETNKDGKPVNYTILSFDDTSKS
ncbi:MAG: hypothetical protein JJW00_00900 [Sulfurimonas sp.]|nr:hypothetical protein [Sulfurimonas sp.]